MIDLSALGLPSVQTPLHGGKGGKAGAANEHDKNGKNFGDLVKEAGNKGGKKHGADDNAAEGLDIDDLAQGLDAGELKAVEDAADLEDGKGVIASLIDGEAAADTSESGGRVQLSAAFQRLMKSNVASGTAADGGAKAQITDPKLAKPQKEETGKDAKPHLDDLEASGKNTEVSPSQELHALLGIATAKDDADEPEAAAEKPAKVVKHEAVDDAPANAKSTASAEIKADAAQTVSQQALVQQAAVHATNTTSADNAADADDAKNKNADTVRLVSTDGKSRPVDIELAKVAGDDSAEPDGAGKTDFVTVLDSRRYLGFSSDSTASNASALTNAIKGDTSWAQVIHNVNTGANQTATEVNTLKLQMNPEHLGNMTASLRLKGDELSVEVRVDTVDAYRQLSNDQDSIVKALKDQGFSIDQVSIQLNPSAKADSGQNSTGQNGQQGSDQNLQQGGQGDNARQRDESARRNANQNNWIGNEKTSSISDSGSGSDTTDSGNLYL